MKSLVVCAILFTAGSITAAQNKMISIWQSGNSESERFEQLDLHPPSNITSVDQPSLTVFLPLKKNINRTAVLIFPGGAYRQIVIAKEGYRIAQWLNDQGITAFVLTYRLNRDSALLDAQQAVRIIRSKTAEYDIQPDRIGVIGFSAGANLALRLATHRPWTAGTTNPPGSVSCRPDFLILAYGSFDGLTKLVDAATPPVFIVHAGDDQRVPVNQSIDLYSALRKAGVSAEMHIYERGGHGFALLKDKGPVVSWAQRCLDWMNVRMIIPSK